MMRWVGPIFFPKEASCGFRTPTSFFLPSCETSPPPPPPPPPAPPPKVWKNKNYKMTGPECGVSYLPRSLGLCSKLHPLLFYSPHSDHAQCVKLCLQDDRCWWQKNTVGIFKVWVDKWVLSWEFQICASIQWLLLHQGSSEFIYLRTDMYFTTRASRLSLDWMAGCWEFW